jgi:beta-lactamase class A
MGVRRFAAAVTSSVLTASVLAACSGGSSVTPPSSAATHPAVTLPDTPAGAQARWLIAAMTHLPIGAAELRAHFDASFLVPISPANINQMLQGIGGVTLASSRASQPSASCAEAVVTAPVATHGTAPVATHGTPVATPPPPPPQPPPPTRPAAKVPAGRCLGATVSAARGPLQLTLVVDPAGLINGLRFGPVIPPAPTTWAGVDAAIRSVAPRVRLLVARVTGRSCQPVHGVDPGTAAPLASASRLYLLDALATSIASGKVSWNQPLTITAQLKSLGSGELKDEPDGTKVPVLAAAARMISSGDNTAADMLINLVGRPGVEAALTAAGMAGPSRDIPFLTTRELITLKLDQWPSLARRYIAASRAGRRALLANVVDRAPQPSATALAAWRTPRDINSIERFGSANDICHVYASLAALARRPGLSPVASVLEANDGGLGLDPAQWQTTWFLAGSEPGVLTSTFMATTRTGHSYVVAVLAENPSAPINQATAVPVLISAIRGAFTLAAHG